MDYEKAYKEALAKAREIHRNEDEKRFDMEWLFPELKESEDERIRKSIICGMNALKEQGKETFATIPIDDAIAWLEKQGTPAKLSEEEQNSFAKGVLSRCALSFIDYLDAHSYEGKMCVSNLECEDIDYAFHNAMWDRLHRYYCKYIEKQGEQKQEWSEEDENYLQSAENACEYQYGKNTSTILWLKSLKDKIKEK